MNQPPKALGIIGLIAAFGLLAFVLWGSASCNDPDKPSDKTGTGQYNGNGDTNNGGGGDGEYHPPSDLPVNTDYKPPPLPSPDIPGGALKTATTYLTEKDNRDSYYRESPRSWVDATADVATPVARSRWDNITADGKPGYSWIWAHDSEVKVELRQVECLTNQDVPSKNPAAMISIRCTWVDVPVYGSGDRVPPNLIDFTFSYNGPQPVASLSMVNQGGKWLVSADATGLAQ